MAGALIDLAVEVAPGLAMQTQHETRRQAWPGLLVILVVILALFSAGQAVAWAVNEALPRREILS